MFCRFLRHSNQSLLIQALLSLDHDFIRHIYSIRLHVKLKIRNYFPIRIQYSFFFFSTLPSSLGSLQPVSYPYQSGSLSSVPFTMRADVPSHNVRSSLLLSGHSKYTNTLVLTANSRNDS